MSELTYTRSGDYLIPDLSLTEQPQAPLGKYGRMRKQWVRKQRIRQHKRKGRWKY